MARGGRPRRIRVGDGRRDPHAALPRAAADRDDAADRAHGARQRFRRVGRDFCRALRDQLAGLRSRRHASRWNDAHRLVRPRALAALDLRASGRHPRRAGDLRPDGLLCRRRVLEAARGNGSRDAHDASVPVGPRLPLAPPREPGVPVRRDRRAGRPARCSSRIPTFPRSSCARTVRWDASPEWYRSFLYAEEKARGLDSAEDLASPGTFRFDLVGRRGDLAGRGRWARSRPRRGRRGGGARGAARSDRAPAARVARRPARPRRRRLPRAARFRADDRRRLSLVHRLGPRHVHRPARTVPRDRTARRTRAGILLEWAGGRLGRHAAEPLPGRGERARVQLGRCVALVRRRRLRLFRSAAAAGRVASRSSGERLAGGDRGDPRPATPRGRASASAPTRTDCSPRARPACS